MPTDLEAAQARKHKAQREKKKQKRTNMTMLSLWVIAGVVMVVLLFLDKSYAQAMQQLMRLF